MQDKEGRETYWALLSDEDVISEVLERRRKFVETVKSSGIYPFMRRSYRFYHGQYYGDDARGDAIKIGGERGQVRLISANEYRSTTKLLAGYITAQKPEWDAIGTASDASVLEAVRLSNDILDSYMLDPTTRLEGALACAMEDALVLSGGYLWCLWDRNYGEESVGDLDAGKIYYKGEYRFLNPPYNNVAYDLDAETFEESEWVIVRRRENRWNLIAESGTDEDKERAILSPEDMDSGAPDDPDFSFYVSASTDTNEDKVWVYYFYHAPTPALPGGKFLRFVGETVLWSGECSRIPVHRIQPGRFLLTSFGYTPAWDAQGPQEALNGVLSAMVTNQNSLASNKVWCRPGDELAIKDITELGVTLVTANVKPESLNFLQSSPELLKGVEIYTSIIERMLSVAPVSRGQVPPAARSAASLAMLDSRTLQNASDLIKNYRVFICAVGTTIVRGLAEQGSERRILSKIGENKARFVKYFRGEQLRGVSRVSITTGNPIMSTLAGRIEVAQFLAQTQLISTPEELLTVVRTGSLDRLTEHNEANLRSAQAENDAFLRGEEVQTVLQTDNHRFHILKHVSILDTPESRNDPQLAKNVYTHCGQHMAMLMDPKVQQMQIVLGYQLPAPPAGGPAPAPKGEGTNMPGGANPEVAALVQKAQSDASLAGPQSQGVL